MALFPTSNSVSWNDRRVSLGGRGRAAVITLVGIAFGAAAPAHAAAPSTSLASLSSTGTKGNAISYAPVVSADGRWVAFASDATNLVTPSPSGTHVYLRDRQRNETRQVDLTPSGGQPNANGFGPSISDDGRFIAFLSAATDLASSPGSVQAFLLDRTSGAFRRIDTDVTPAGPYDYVNDVTISGDGRKVAFTGLDFLPTSTVNDADVFVADVASGAVQRVGEPTPGVSANGWVLNPSLSGDGRWVSYQSAATDLVAGDGRQDGRLRRGPPDGREADRVRPRRRRPGERPVIGLAAE